MTFNPTEKAQQKWIDTYLNGGICSENSDAHFRETAEDTACYSALNWLSGTNIKTLAEVWERCNKVEWLGWMHARMKPSKKDLRLWYNILEDLIKEIINGHQEELTTFELEELADLKIMIDYALRESPSNSDEIADLIENCSEEILYINRDYSNEELANIVRKKIPNPWMMKSQRTK